MHENKNDAPTSKVFYRPLEASIRWAGLLRYEQVILASISSPRRLPQSLDCPRCDELRLCALRDEVAHGLTNGVHAHRDAHSLALGGLEEAGVLDVEGDEIQLGATALERDVAENLHLVPRVENLPGFLRSPARLNEHVRHLPAEGEHCFSHQRSPSW